MSFSHAFVAILPSCGSSDVIVFNAIASCQKRRSNYHGRKEAVLGADKWSIKLSQKLQIPVWQARVLGINPRPVDLSASRIDPTRRLERIIAKSGELDVARQCRVL